jgi:hypothetical protein
LKVEEEKLAMGRLFAVATLGRGGLLHKLWEKQTSSRMQAVRFEPAWADL